MRYREIVEATTGQEVWAAKQATHDALRVFRGKQQKAHDARATARESKPGPARTRKLAAADNAEGDARRVYSNALARSHQKATDAFNKD